MSLKAINAVWECPHLTSSQKLVSAYMANNIHDESAYTFSASKNTCIKKTGLTKDTIYKVFSALENGGFISRIGHSGDGVILYRMNIELYLNYI